MQRNEVYWWLPHAGLFSLRNELSEMKLRDFRIRAVQQRDARANKRTNGMPKEQQKELKTQSSFTKGLGNVSGGVEALGRKAMQCNAVWSQRIMFV
jgi:hypothetical protein